jgi:UDP-N-acetylglucosamine 4,6-dehydratase
MDGKTILVTGGTGSLGQKLISTLFEKFIPKKVIVYSRDEFKQSEMRKTHDYDDLRYFIGDVRDKDRLKLAMKGVDVVIHAAALKQVPALEYNPMEAVKTNILGTQNVIEACLDRNVDKAIFISTDKAVNPINLYGATKMAAEKLWNAANSYAVTKFSSVRYGNVIGSRGSVIPLFQSIEGDTVPVTDPKMTRFWITLEQAVELIIRCYRGQNVGGVYIPLIKSMDMESLVQCLGKKVDVIGIRPGEKMHETLAPEGEEVFIVDFEKEFSYIAIVTDGGYNSNTCSRLTKEEMLCLIAMLDKPVRFFWQHGFIKENTPDGVEIVADFGAGAIESPPEPSKAKKRIIDILNIGVQYYDG